MVLSRSIFQEDLKLNLMISKLKLHNHVTVASDLKQKNSLYLLIRYPYFDVFLDLPERSEPAAIENVIKTKSRRTKPVLTPKRAREKKGSRGVDVTEALRHRDLRYTGRGQFLAD